MTAREFHNAPTVGIPVIDRMIGKFMHPARVATMQEQFLPGVFKSWTCAPGGERVLRDALAEVAAADIIGKARAEHDAKVASLRDIAESLPAFAKDAAAAALAAVVRDPSAKTAALLLQSRAQLAEADRTADYIEKSLGDAEQVFLASEPHRAALVKVCKAIIPALKKSDAAIAVRLAVRAAVLAEGIATGHPDALNPAVEFVNGRGIGESLDLGLIPEAWVEKGIVPGFAWDDTSIDFA